MRVDPKDGACHSSGGTLQITDADAATMTVGCDDCGDCYLVATDAFDDGAMTYYVEFLAQRLGRGNPDDE